MILAPDSGDCHSYHVATDQTGREGDAAGEAHAPWASGYPGRRQMSKRGIFQLRKLCRILAIFKVILFK